jgi:hypothetical protein
VVDAPSEAKQRFESLFAPGPTDGQPQAEETDQQPPVQPVKEETVSLPEAEAGAGPEEAPVVVPEEELGAAPVEECQAKDGSGQLDQEKPEAPGHAEPSVSETAP